jgi:hypothetical protein
VKEFLRGKPGKATTEVDGYLTIGPDLSHDKKKPWYCNPVNSFVIYCYFTIKVFIIM